MFEYVHASWHMIIYQYFDCQYTYKSVIVILISKLLYTRLLGAIDVRT